MFGEIKQDLADFGVEFDVYFHEHDVQANGDVERAIDWLRELGHIFENDGATWLRTTDFGDDKDRVIVRSTRCTGVLFRRPSPTTSTSASAASTSASSCSAPTTTAMSVA